MRGIRIQRDIQRRTTPRARPPSPPVGHRARRLTLQAALLAIACSIHSLGHADGLATVVILSMKRCCEAEAWPEAEETLKSELDLDDVRTIVRESQAETVTERLDEMRRAAEQSDATAVVRLTRVAERSEVVADLWLAEPDTDRFIYRRLHMEAPQGAVTELNVAVRTVEALWASLVELQFSDTADPPLAVPLPPPGRYPHFGVGAGGSLATSPGGIGLRGGFALSAVVTPLERLDIELNIQGLPLGEQLSTRNGTTTVGLLQVRGALFYRFETPIPLKPALGVGAGTLFLYGEGESRYGGPSIRDQERVATVTGAVRLYLEINPVLSLFLDGFSGVTIPKVRMVQNNLEAASLGRPFIDATLGVQLRYR